MTVADYVNYWYNTYRIIRHSTATAKLTNSIIRVHIKESELGQMDITEAKAIDYQIFLRDLLLSGNKNRLESLKDTYGNPLSPRVVSKIRQLLVGANNWAVKEEIIPKNYAAETEFVPCKKGTSSVFSIENQRTFLRYTRNHRYYVAYVLFFYTGCRRSEILGLSWNNVHRKENYIVIDQTLIMEGTVPVLKKHHAKTQKSLRTIPIPKDIRLLFSEVEQRQKLEKRKNPNWSNPDDLVFTGKDGSRVNPAYFSRNFKNVCKRLGFSPDLHLHSTRHSWATNMLQCGIAISDVQALGGWTSPDMLLNIYAHTVKESHRTAITKLYKKLNSM